MQARLYGVQLKLMFNPKTGGLPISTITVLTDEVVDEDIWTAFHDGWSTPWGNNGTSTESPVTEMIRENDAATVCQVGKIIKELPYC